MFVPRSGAPTSIRDFIFAGVSFMRRTEAPLLITHPNSDSPPHRNPGSAAGRVEHGVEHRVEHRVRSEFIIDAVSHLASPISAVFMNNLLDQQCF